LVELLNADLASGYWRPATKRDRALFGPLVRAMYARLTGSEWSALTVAELARAWGVQPPTVKQRLSKWSESLSAVGLQGLIDRCRYTLAMARSGLSDEQILKILKAAREMPYVSVRPHR